MIRILVVDDHEMMVDAMCELLTSSPDTEVVGKATSLRAALPIMERTQPDLVLADLSLQDGSGTELVRAVRQSRLKTNVLIVSAFRDGFAASEAIKMGVAGYILKSSSARELFDAIATVMKGERYLSPIVAQQLAEQPQGPGIAGLTALSRREGEVFRLVVQGCSSKDIARRFCISIKTVETHRSNINRKLSVRRTTDLIRFAVAQGISVAPNQVENGLDRST